MKTPPTGEWIYPRGGAILASRALWMLSGWLAFGVLPFSGFAARPWPDTGSRIVPFSDQLPDGLSATQREFAATRFAGTQKMTRSAIRALRVYNPDFLCLHYQLAVGAGPEAFIVGDSWSSDWTYVDAQSSWFLQTAAGQRIHQTQWNWDVMDMRYVDGHAISGFPAYWISSCLARIRAAEDDGVFADSFTPDGYGFGQTAPPHPWLEDVDLCLANWVPALEQFGAEAKAALSGTNGFVFLPNLGGLVTSWLDMDYGVGHGGMIECFAYWGAGNYFDAADWELQMDRALALTRSNKIVICQSYPAEDSARERMFATASYLLIKGSRTYLNLLSTDSVALEYYPEYTLDLGAAVGAVPSGIAALWHAGWGVFRRDYAKGVVVVNPTASPVTIPNLGATYWRAVPTGGGIVAEDGQYGGSLSVVAATSLTLPAFSGAVLFTVNPFGQLSISPSSATISPAASSGRQIAVTANVSWTATASQPWITISGGAAGTGNGTVTYGVGANAGAVRSGTITVAGNGITRTFAVNQWPVPATPGVSAEGDVDGDGLADLSVYHPATGNWHVLFGAGVGWVVPWGWSATLPVPADYNGDGMLDFAAYHPTTGNWHIQESATGRPRQIQFGWSATVPLPGDYDGDGRADLAVYHPAAGRWYFLCSTAGRYSVQWGWSSAIPVPADYDGDGITDVAVYHPASGLWQILKSSTGGAIQKRWGWSSAIPVPADYDGDGRADVAVFHRASGTWYVAYSGGGSLTQPFGWSTTIPVAADYDGDGAADLAVYHPASGNWYVLKSTTGGIRTQNWGWNSAQPILLYPLIHSWFMLK